MADTDCRNCGAPMPPVSAPVNGRLAAFFGGTYKVTAYRCEACDHWNNLARRKKTEPTEPPGGGA